ncbi:ABC transporter ATP-binding protein [Candidatus Halobonum tyrrellensis]|uniref:Molybdate/tungstate import ATP-binding protein WtpC n=1 Tax=Candidatus Halobonum tyrrellensis G22 TaxID=1324957 RepID=V4GY96_9EURY|nr:ABC transporter ATP-binding protein [Candidatus Halobonum tyrrellensis]ESP90161.1 spermidine/putrescine ABC transporter ATPase component [Candidatus Halobonum tyrrellensis G22]
MATTDSVVNLSDVRKQFGETLAVDGIDFDLRQGEFFSLLGPSGCGKTTTLRMISGFETPTNGRIEIEGENVVSLPPNKRNTNLVFQGLSLFPHMSVAENVGYGLKKAGVDADERERRVEDYLDIVGLSGYEDRNPTELSGGQQQRVAIARALVNEPDILLLDEPLSSLDRKLRQRMQVELQQIHERVEGTFFYVTHDQDVAMSMSDRLAVMNDGEIEQIGTPEEIYREPASQFVADFIGDTNFLSGSVETTDTTAAFQVDDADASIPLAAPSVSGDAVASVRPEEVSLHPVGEGTVDGEVVDSHFHGNHTTYIVDTDEAVLPELEVVVQGRSPVSTGDRVAVGFNADALKLFAA